MASVLGSGTPASWNASGAAVYVEPLPYRIWAGVLPEVYSSHPTKVPVY